MILCTFQGTQTWQKESYNGGFAGTILIDLSQSYHCIPHEFLIAKLECYDIYNRSLQLLLLDYLTIKNKGFN